MHKQKKRKVKKGLFGGVQRIDATTYSEHLEQFQDVQTTEISVGTKEAPKILRVSTVQFDDEVVSKLEFGKMLDDLSDEERDAGAYDLRDNNSSAGCDELSATEQKRAHYVAKAAAKGRKVPLSSEEREDYDAFMKEGAMEATPEVEAAIKRQFTRIRTQGVNRTKRVNPKGRKLPIEDRSATPVDELDQPVYI
jgi:hypothetical protein